MSGGAPINAMGLGLHTDRRGGGSDGDEGGLQHLFLHTRQEQQQYVIHYTRNSVLTVCAR